MCSTVSISKDDSKDIEEDYVTRFISKLEALATTFTLRVTEPTGY